MKFKMACGYLFRIYFYFLILVLTVTNSLQLINNGKEAKSCDCYEECHKNFTGNSIKDEQTREACKRGCRFFSLLLHVSYNPVDEYGHARERCITSCSEGYINTVEAAACNFGCSSMNMTDSCDAIEHQLPQITYAFLIEESDVLVHPGEADPDDVLIDPGLRKQIEKTLETFLDSKPKLPEIHFRNLPVINKEIPDEHPRTTFKCHNFYGFDSKIEFPNGKITTSDLLFLFSLSVFAMICFVVSRNLEKQRKLWKQLLINLLHNRPTIVKMKDGLTKDESLLQADYPDNKKLTEETINNSENIDSKFEAITLVFYDNGDDEYDSPIDAKPNHNNSNHFP